MKTIEYRATYGGRLVRGIGMTDVTDGVSSEEIVRVQARDINGGYAKALKLARQPLGNGLVRQLLRIEFWQVV